jgi:hypothetical protein
MIKTTSYNQQEIIENILQLHCPTGIQLDPTYSKGMFYKGRPELEPKEKFDLFPQTENTKQATAENLPHTNNTVSSIMFDPPFLAGYTKQTPTGKMGERFHGFRYVPDLWAWYDLCLAEFYRILKPSGVLIFKCQDTVSGGKQWISHNHIINKAEGLGFYTKDIFILLAKNRMTGHNHTKQQHARKFHSYFLVLVKKS